MIASRLLKSFRLSESGATAIEYAILAAIVGIGIVAGASSLVVRQNLMMIGVSNWVKDPCFWGFHGSKTGGGATKPGPSC